MYHARQEVIVYKLVLLTIVLGNACVPGFIQGRPESVGAWCVVGGVVLFVNLPILALMTWYARWVWKTSWKDAFWRMTRLLCGYILAMAIGVVVLVVLLWMLTQKDRGF